jgi:DNA gyrase subunit A
MSSLYNGNSEGFAYVQDGYIDYAKEVISGRAIPDLRDGMKPVHRRILFAAHKNLGKGGFQKCAAFVSEALKLHPHGDGSVYGAFTLMTDRNGSWNMPVFAGMGNLGHVYSSAPAAAFRYPKAMLNGVSDEYFREYNVMDFVPAEEGVGMEPVVLYPTYPAVLVNGTSGIAVSVNTNIPAFNFGDVCDLVSKYINNGDLSVTDIIYPDFPTGGVLVTRDSEVAKIMATGEGKLKVRAKVEINGKEIVVTEVPFGKTFESIKRAAEESEIQGISTVMNLTDLNSDGQVVISCKSKKIVEYVLMELYRKNILQNTYSSRILVTMDGKPMMLGVHGIIKKWTEWRMSVLRKKFQKELDGIADELLTLGYFNRLISNPEWRDTYVDKATKKSRAEADFFLRTIFPDIPADVCTWINGRAISAFNNGGRYQNRYADLTKLQETHKDNLAHPEKYILAEMARLKKEMAGQYDRKTIISNTDYRFSKVSDTEEVEDDSYCIYTIRKDGYIMKTREPVDIDKKLVIRAFEGAANSVLIGFDNFGRLLRISGTEIPFTGYGEEGAYLPKLFEATFERTYKVLYMGVLDGKRRMLVYRDGFIGFLDTSEFLGKKVVRYVSNGVPACVRGLLMEVYEQDEVPNCLIFAEQRGEKLKLGVVDTANIPERSRTSRAKVFAGTGINTQYIRGADYMGIRTYLRDPDKFLGALKKATVADFLGDPAEMEDGFYLEMNIEE